MQSNQPLERGKFIENLIQKENFKEKYDQILKDLKVPCILLNTGSYCPPHYGHVDLLVQAKNFLEKKTDYRVIQSYMSPSNDGYVESKSIKYGFHEFFIDFEQRVQILQKSIKEKYENEEIYLDLWEGSHQQFIDFPTVTVSLQHYFNNKQNEGKFDKIKVILCMGSDMLKTSFIDKHSKMHYQNQIYQIPLVIVDRKNIKIHHFEQPYLQLVNSTIQQMISKQEFFVETTKENISSSLIREILLKYNPSDKQMEQQIKEIMHFSGFQVLLDIKNKNNK